MTIAKRLDEVMGIALFTDDEIIEGQTPDDAVIVPGIVRTFGFHPTRLESQRLNMQKIIREVVSDEFIKGKGGGHTFLNLCIDRNGHQWGEPSNMEVLLVLSIGLGLAGFCFDRDLWPSLPGGMPYVWFDDSISELVPPQLAAGVAPARGASAVPRAGREKTGERT